jgi:hypothetical protein
MSRIFEKWLSYILVERCGARQFANRDMQQTTDDTTATAIQLKLDLPAGTIPYHTNKLSNWQCSRTKLHDTKYLTDRIEA